VARILDKLKWNLYLAKKDYLYDYGFDNGFIRTYDEELIENLRNIYYGGIPASIMLLCHEVCDGDCYNMALLMSCGFGDDDFQLVDAKINGIILNPEMIDNYSKYPEKYQNPGVHRFVERTMKDGSVLVYDTSEGFIFEKNLFYKLENPKITNIIDKKEILNYLEYNNQNKSDDNSLLLKLSEIEEAAKKQADIYKDLLLKEIDLFKKELSLSSNNKLIKKY